MYEGHERTPEDERRGVPAARSGISPALIGVAVVVVLAVVFALQNTEEAPIRFLFFERQTPVWVAIAIAIALGIIIDRLLVFLWRRRRRVR